MPQTRWLETIQICRLVVLEAGSPKSGVSRACALRCSKGGAFFAVPSLWHSLAVLGIAGLVDASLQSHGGLLPVCLHIVFPLGTSAPVSKFPLFISTPS